jgi:DNA replication licensing factor MCM4
LLTSYISYAREIFKPNITEEAGEELVKQYVEMRKLGEDVRASEKRITATTRQLESMIRLSEAHAKMRFSEDVEVSDVKEAARLIRSAIKEYATDPLTGKIDMELITTGLSTHQRRARSDLRREVVRLVDQMTEGSNAPARVGDLLRMLNEQSNLNIGAEELGGVLDSLAAEGGIVVGGTGSSRTVRKVMGATIV